MGRQFNNAVSVLHSAIRFGWIKILNGERLRSSIVERFSPNVVFTLDRGGRASLGPRIRAHSGCKFIIRKGASLEIEEDVSFNYSCMIVCRDSIKIGQGTEFGPSVYLYDHDHDYRAGLKNKQFLCSPITIGKNCWIGANTVILRGTTIGDNCVIGAGCVVKGTIPDHSILTQKRESVLRQIGTD